MHSLKSTHTDTHTPNTKWVPHPNTKLKFFHPKSTICCWHFREFIISWCVCQKGVVFFLTIPTSHYVFIFLFIIYLHMRLNLSRLSDRQVSRSCFRLDLTNVSPSGYQICLKRTAATLLIFHLGFKRMHSQQKGTRSSSQLSPPLT